MRNLKLIDKLCDDCIEEGENVLNSKWEDKKYLQGKVFESRSYVELEDFKKWKSNCNVLMKLLGDLSAPWSEIIDGDMPNSYGKAISILGALKSIRQTIDNGYLIRIEDLIYSEAFSNLLEQAEYLLKQKYFLASAVISRAVLEEKLRNICVQQEIAFDKSKPTLSDFNQALYKSKFFSKVELKNVDLFITIGNNAAHNKDFENGDASKLLHGVMSILSKYS